MSLLGNFKKLVAGSALSQLLTLLSLPIISYLYGPSALGYLGSFMAIVSIIGMVSSMRLERELFRLSDKSEQSNIINVATVVAVTTAAFISLFFYIAISLKYIDISLAEVILLYLTAVSVSLAQVFSVYLSSRGNFVRVAKSSVLRSFVLVAGQISFFFLFEQKIALILSAVFSSTSALFYLLKGIDYRINFKQTKQFVYKKENLSKMASGFVQAGISSLNNNSNVLLVSVFLGVSSAGLFVVAEKLVRAPINLITNNLRPVFAKHYQQKQNVEKAFKYCLILALISFSILSVAYFIIDFLFIYFFDEEYYGALPIIKVLLIWIFFNFVQLPFQSYNLHFLTVHYLTAIEVLSFLVKVISFFLLLYFEQGIFSICIAMLLSVVNSTLLNAVVFVHLKKRVL